MGTQYTQIARELGVREGTVREHYRNADRKIREGKATIPIEAPAVMDINDVIETGLTLPPSVRDAVRTGTAIRPEDLITLTESAWLRTLLAMLDPTKLRKATLSALATAHRTFTENMQLFKGQPTAIVRHEDIRKLDEVGRLLMQEMQRRNITFGGEAVATAVATAVDVEAGGDDGEDVDE